MDAERRTAIEAWKRNGAPNEKSLAAFGLRVVLATPAVTETADLRAALECLIVAFRRWHIDRHGYAPTVHDFRLMLDMAAGTSDTEEET